MRFSLVTLLGLAAFSNNLGAYARAIPNDLSVRAPPEPVGSLEGYYLDDNSKRAVPGRPAAPRPQTPRPQTPNVPRPDEPITPDVPASEPKTPQVNRPQPNNANPGAGEKSGTVKQDPDAVSDSNTCGIVSARDLHKRGDAERVPDDAEDWKKVYMWLKETGLPRENLVFYSGDEGLKMAKDFVKTNPSYEHFWTIFNEDFQEDFGDASMDKEVSIACSKALASWARDPVVFNADNAKPESFWLNYEYPRMTRAGTITKLQDNAQRPDQTAGKIDLPAAGDATC